MGVRSQPPLSSPPGFDTLSEQISSENNLSSASTRSSNSLATKVTAVLSTSFADGEFREALCLLDQQGFTNDAKARRQVRLDLHRDVMDCNGAIIDKFGRVAEVCSHPFMAQLIHLSVTINAATTSSQTHTREAKCGIR